MICLEKIYFYLILFTFFFSPTISYSENNPFEYRGVKIGMTKQQISELDSVKFRYMPSPLDLDCSPGYAYYSFYNDDVFVRKKRNKIGGFLYSKEKSIQNERIFIQKRLSGIEICNERKISIKPYQLNGLGNLKSNNITYKFYQGKLYDLRVNYRDSSQDGMDLYTKIQKRFNNSKYVNKIRKETKEKENSTEYFVEYNSINNKDLNIRIIISFRKKQKFGITYNKKYTGMNFFHKDWSIYKDIDEIAIKLLFDDIEEYKNQKYKKLKQKKLNNKKRKELEKKYQY